MSKFLPSLVALHDKINKQVVDGTVDNIIKAVALTVRTGKETKGSDLPLHFLFTYDEAIDLMVCVRRAIRALEGNAPSAAPKSDTVKAEPCTDADLGGEG